MKQSKKKILKDFDPNGVGLDNGRFIGLPFDKSNADIVLLPVPWDVTVSFGAGTSKGPQNILDCSSQLDLYLEDNPDFWKQGIFFKSPSRKIAKKNNRLRKLSSKHIQNLEQGNPADKKILDEVNNESYLLKKWVRKKTRKLLKQGKKVGIVGGEHSVPLGFLEALAERHKSFGILQIDAHCDLRESYEGFTYSHASIFNNALQIPQIKKLVQVGIRDFCEQEAQMAMDDGRIHLYSMQEIRESSMRGFSFSYYVNRIIQHLPKKVYVSFDIDGLEGHLCPNTGTPVPDGFSFAEAVFILKALKESGRKVIGFDLCEVAGKGKWDGNVGARVLYRLCSLL